jgi:glucokinase
MTELFAGLDIGGQSIKGIVVDADGAMVAEASRATPASSGAKAVLDAVACVVGELSRVGQLVSVGVGTPGGVDPQGVIVGMAANIEGWYGTELGAEISSMTQGAPCGVRNDGNIATYAEWAVRGGRTKNLLFLGLGTGIGGGYVEDGRILGGRDDRAPEVGHFIIEPRGRRCACGVDGCSEAYASGPSIGRIAAALARGEDAKLGSIGVAAAETLLGRRATERDYASFLAGSALVAQAQAGQSINAREVYEAYASGDKLGVFADAIMIESLARTTATALALLAPDLVVFGGGVIKGAPHIPAGVASLVPKLVYRDAWKNCGFEGALLSHKAGLLGAAWYGAALTNGKDYALRLAAAASDRI